MNFKFLSIKLDLILVSGILLLVTFLIILFPNPLRLMCPNCFGMELYQNKIYIEPKQSSSFIESVYQEYAQATKQLEAWLGPLQGKPTIVICNTWSCYEKFGGKQPHQDNQPIPKGTAYGNAWIRISPAGINRTYIAHELCHIELHHRIGTWKSYTTLPAWFDEGVAVVLSEDPRFTETVWNQTKIGKLNFSEIIEFNTPKKWREGVSYQENLYLSAGHHVRLWLAKNGKKGLNMMINGLKSNESFEQLYNHPK